MTRLSAAVVCLIFLVSAALADDASRNGLRSMRGKNGAASDQAADDLVYGLRWTHSIPELDSMPEEPPQHRALWPKISAPKISPPKIKSPDLGNLGKAAGTAAGGAVGTKYGGPVGGAAGAAAGGRLGEKAGNWAEERLGGSFGYRRLSDDTADAEEAADDLVSGLEDKDAEEHEEEPPQHRALWPKISAPKIPAPKIPSPDLGNLGKAAGTAAGGAVGTKYGGPVGGAAGAAAGGRLGEKAGNWAEERLGGSFGYRRLSDDTADAEEAADDLVSGLEDKDAEEHEEEPPQHRALQFSLPKIPSPDLGNLGKAAGTAAGGAVGTKYGGPVGGAAGAAAGGRLGEKAGNWAEERLGGSFGY
ncbi:unnamed protein product [Vitrella brassicaformis CCMP3155]|uniref:Glycine zipper domain-containing protein n=1 Tax=Vitrella brassicaformis (strain CCMP3155) TaxID=1169540 RepID=A0A0G4EGK9_VITBC|nr:unnamed protein product [Vitrella brassicaformis CCMP3155]|eukprot:CEL95573.1 unnamed protein product [Vitrella brassicaformis CCMP3155]